MKITPRNSELDLDFEKLAQMMEEEPGVDARKKDIEARISAKINRNVKEMVRELYLIRNYMTVYPDYYAGAINLVSKAVHTLEALREIEATGDYQSQ